MTTTILWSLWNFFAWKKKSLNLKVGNPFHCPNPPFLSGEMEAQEVQWLTQGRKAALNQAPNLMPQGSEFLHLHAASS